jgi:glycosyltransferase involved in cell wall biosynthesis
MSAPRVSVICIFYQAERFLAEALNSVLAQDFDDWTSLST